MNKSKIFLMLLVLAILLGALFIAKPKKADGPVACTQEAKICPDGTSVSRMGPLCEFTECPTVSQKMNFGTAYTLKVDAPITFTDGLNITIQKIGDSRCKEGVQCIWAGELNPVIQAWSGTLGETVEQVHLGTTTAKSAKISGYTFVLNSATENTATVTVTKNFSK